MFKVVKDEMGLSRDERAVLVKMVFKIDLKDQKQCENGKKKKVKTMEAKL